MNHPALRSSLTAVGALPREQKQEALETNSFLRVRSNTIGTFL